MRGALKAVRGVLVLETEMKGVLEERLRWLEGRLRRERRV